MVGAQLVVLVGVCLLLGGVLSARLHVAAPVVLLLLGAAAGGVLGALPGGHMVALPPEVVLVLFLPVLLHWASITTSLREIRADPRSISLRAVGLVLLTAAAVVAVSTSRRCPASARTSTRRSAPSGTGRWTAWRSPTCS